MKKYDYDDMSVGGTIGYAVGRNSTNGLCVCGHQRLGHTYDPRDYDRYECQTCECPKFEAAIDGRDRPTYALRKPKPVPLTLTYREIEDEDRIDRIDGVTGPAYNWDDLSS